MSGRKTLGHGLRRGVFKIEINPWSRSFLTHFFLGITAYNGVLRQLLAGAAFSASIMQKLGFDVSVVTINIIYLVILFMCLGTLYSFISIL